MRGLVAIANDRRDGAIVPSGSSAQVLLGHGHLVEELAGVPIEVGAGEFLQVNRARPRRCTRASPSSPRRRPGCSAVDLFAGLGGIGLHLARAGAEVIAVEIDRDAVAQLRRAAERASLPLTAIAGDAGDMPATCSAARQARRRRRQPAAQGPVGRCARACSPSSPRRRSIYVSCGPESLGRDLAALAEHGWQPDVDRAVRPDARHRAGRDDRAPAPDQLNRQPGAVSVDVPSAFFIWMSSRRQ